MNRDLRDALVKVRAHTSYTNPTVELLAGLLASIERIVDAALKSERDATPPATVGRRQDTPEARAYWEGLERLAADAKLPKWMTQTPPATPEPPKTDAQIRDWLERAEAGRLTAGEIRAWLHNPMVAHGEVERWVITQLLGMLSQSPAASGDVERLRNALIKVRAHTAYRPGASRDLLAGLLASIERIVDAALRAGDRPTPGGTTP